MPRTKRKIISFPSGVDRFSIDALDHKALETILRGCGYQHHFWDKIKEMVWIADTDSDRRVQRLRFSGAQILYLSPSIGRLEKLQILDLIGKRQLRSLPDEIGDLGDLISLNLRHSGLTEIPPSIGQLKNLKELDLSGTQDLLDLPQEIGNLCNLVKLRLEFSGIRLIPASIGQLTNLQQLNLHGTSKLRSLPDEIGNLRRLITWSMGASGVMALPASIGQLQNLQELYLNGSFHTRELPEEIGNLGNLIKMSLYSSRIESLPKSIGKLQKLEYLNLNYTKRLTSLPEEIGNLVNLAKLTLDESAITLLPKSVQRLDKLRFLQLSCNGMSYRNRYNYASSLVQSCKSLGWIREELAIRNQYALACNRYRYRTSAIGSDFSSTSGWPIILANATHPFRAYDDDVFNAMFKPETLEGHDAIYRILVDQRESFVTMLISRTESWTSDL